MIIVDTGIWLALSNSRDKHHHAAVDKLKEVKEPLATTWPVLTEACHMIRMQAGVYYANKFVRQVLSGPCYVWDIAAEYRLRIPKLMHKYRDLPMDLADASLVLLAEHLNDGRILSTDRRDFRSYRWKERKPFANLFDAGAGHSK